MSEIERLTKLLAEAATKGRQDHEEIASLKKSLADMTLAKSSADRTIADWEIQVRVVANTKHEHTLTHRFKKTCLTHIFIPLLMHL